MRTWFCFFGRVAGVVCAEVEKEASESSAESEHLVDLSLRYAWCRRGWSAGNEQEL